jgi:hypothetical protein
MGVNLWGESPHDTRTKGIQPYRMLTKVRADGKGDSVRNGLEEAGWRKCEPTDRNRITHKWVPGLSLWASGHDITKPFWFRRQGKCGGCARKVHVFWIRYDPALIRGDLSDMRQVRVMSAIIRNPEAPWVVTPMVADRSQQRA